MTLGDAVQRFTGLANRSASRRHRRDRASKVWLRVESLEDRRLLALNPTGLEQEMLEHVNRMRTDPQGELQVLFSGLNPLQSPNADVNSALSAFGVDRATLQSQWSSLTPVAPLAWNEALYNAARTHSQQMIAQDMQSHQLLGEDALVDRVFDAGYVFSGSLAIRENVFAYAQSPFHAHAAMAIDWGYGPDGMNIPPQHRGNVMDPDFQEIGIGVLPDSNSQTQVGPLVLTQDFGHRGNYGNPRVLGVVFHDANANGRYDSGEGRGGVTVNLVGGTSVSTTTMTAGGYQIQVAPGSYTVTASGGGLSQTFDMGTIVVGSDNVKLDLNTFSGTDSQIMDDGDAGFTKSGGWVHSAQLGAEGDMHYSSAGTGRDVASWTFPLTPGQYRVSASWIPHRNRATNSPFTIRDGSSTLGIARVNQERPPDDLQDANISWEDLGGPYTIRGNSLVVQLSDDANEYVIADAIRVERIGDVPAGPEIEVLDGGTHIVDGGTIDFGTTSLNERVDKQLTVRNVGSQNLTLTPISSGTLPSGFSLVSNFGRTSLTPGQSTTFTIGMQSAAEGDQSGAFSFVNNDGDESPFGLSLQGIVAAASTAQFIDNGDAGFSTSGSWVHFVGQGFANDISYSSRGTGADVARWTFNVAPGLYRVSATWTAYSNRASDAQFSIRDGSTTIGTVAVNQKRSPNDLSDRGTSWAHVGGFYEVTGSRLIVELSDDADGYVIADAVRIEQIVDLPTTQIIDDGESGFSRSGGWVHFVGQGYQNDVTYSARGTGADVVTWSFAVTPGRYQVAARWEPHANRATDAPYTIRDGSGKLATVRINQELAPNDFSDAGSSWETLGGPYNVRGTMLVVNLSDDADQYVMADAVRIERVGDLPPAAGVIIDNGESGFATSGGWVHFNGQGFNGDISYSSAGTGADVATWTFSVTPGRYRVSATWTHHRNRGTDAPYTILDGSEVLARERINQERPPDDFSDSGATWEDLGSFDVSGTTVVVRLSDKADGYVIADAVRLERI